MGPITSDAEACLDELATVIRQDRLSPTATAERLEMISYFYRELLNEDVRDWVLARIQEPLLAVAAETVTDAELRGVKRTRLSLHGWTKHLLGVEMRLQVLETLLIESVQMTAVDASTVRDATALDRSLSIMELTLAR